jgi:hypothetical protein
MSTAITTPSATAAAAATGSHTRPVPLACSQCRRSHLKCDGGQPTCVRCQVGGQICTYTGSARGRRRPRDPRRSHNDNDTDLAGQPTGTQAPLHPVPSWIALPADLNGSSPLGPTLGRVPDRFAPSVDDDQLVDLYYLHFHPNHPILLPKSMFSQQNYPPCLTAVVQLIGSYFSPVASRDLLSQAAARELQHGDQATPEMVQARVLYAIAVVGQDQLLEGQSVLDLAIETALKLGMHRRDFAEAYGGTLTVLQESMRRTWYEIYAVDGYMAALQRQSTFRTNTVEADVLLPCEDSTYEVGMCFVPAAVEDFHRSAFAEEEVVFSSYCDRNEAVRLLGRVLMITGTQGIAKDLVQAVDNALAAFVHHLPHYKSEAEIMNTYGELDMLMFQTHTIIQYSTILLHLPRGDLKSPHPLIQEVPGGNLTKLLCPCNREHVHSIKAIEASKSTSMLAALHTTEAKHTPFFVYPLALAVVVQLSVSKIHARSSGVCLEQHRDRVQVMLGVLKSLSRYWSTANMVLRKLKKVAFLVFQDFRNDSSLHTARQVLIDGGVDTNFFTPIDGDWLCNFGSHETANSLGWDNAA